MAGEVHLLWRLAVGQSGYVDVMARQAGRRLADPSVAEWLSSGKPREEVAPSRAGVDCVYVGIVLRSVQ